MTPYLSIVMGIGGDVTDDLLDRLEKSIFDHAKRAEDFMVATEIVIVEWATEPLDYDNLIDVPQNTGTLIRVIHAGHLHSQVPNPHGFRYFEWYPKNIGIRRAEGQFVLCTNPDDLITSGMFNYFRTVPLQSGHFYRANRHDLMDGKVFRICYPTGCFPPDATEETIRTQVAVGSCPWSPEMLHYNASGDFMLMSKGDWFKIRGNPERDYNHSVDGQTVFLAHQMGLQQVILPYPIYHPDHERTLNHAYAPEWDDKKPHTKQNGVDWGFAGMEFKETIL